eukprot:5578821-Pyramimonas_sp.AAC.1
MIRFLLDEAAIANGKHVACPLLDLTKFYDSVSLVLLLQFAEQTTYPMMVTPMEVQMCLAPRHLTANLWISPRIMATRSL